MFRLFSRRMKDAENAGKPEALYDYEIDSRVRQRILHTLSQVCERENYGHLFPEILNSLSSVLPAQYGEIDVDRRVINQGVSISSVVHFLSCSHERALDWLELFFQAPPGFQGNFCVEPLNRILQEEGIGYEFTQLIERDGGPGFMFGREVGRKIERDYPQAIKKSEQYTHQAIVQPCLHALSDSAFKTAHGEMLKAHDAFRQGDYPESITACCAAFESVLKTVCGLKGIAHDPHKDACAALLQKCQAADLFPSFYAEAFKASGTIRNNLGSAHGRGPTPKHKVSKDQADHMIQMTSSHITLLVKLATV